MDPNDVNSNQSRERLSEAEKRVRSMLEATRQTGVFWYENEAVIVNIDKAFWYYLLRRDRSK